MNQCPHCKRRIPISTIKSKQKITKKQINVQQVLKHISIYDIFEEFSKKKDEQTFDFMKFLIDAVQQKEHQIIEAEPRQRKKWDINHTK